MQACSRCWRHWQPWRLFCLQGFRGGPEAAWAAPDICFTAISKPRVDSTALEIALGQAFARIAGAVLVRIALGLDHHVDIGIFAPVEIGRASCRERVGQYV